MKNINIPSTKEYLLNLTHSLSTFSNNLRWRVIFHLDPPERASSDKEYFGFKSLKPAPPVEGLKEFEEKLVGLIENIETKEVTSDFQDKLRKDTKDIKKEEKVIVAADKTTNFYKVTPETYNNLLTKNITKDYKKAEENVGDKINKDSKKIAEKLDLEERIFVTTKKPASITFKDHKDNFENNPKCRLINPTKNELGKISKQKVEKIVKEVKEKRKLKLWKNTNSVLDWFKNIERKSRKSFINFDVVDFYPSITEELLTRALDFAGKHTTITEEDRQIILHTKRPLLYNNNIPWTKKSSDFDVAMGSFDGAEVCEPGVQKLGIMGINYIGQIAFRRTVWVWRIRVICQTSDVGQRRIRVICWTVLYPTVQWLDSAVSSCPMVGLCCIQLSNSQTVLCPTV